MFCISSSQSHHSIQSTIHVYHKSHWSGHQVPTDLCEWLGEFFLGLGHSSGLGRVWFTLSWLWEILLLVRTVHQSTFLILFSKHSLACTQSLPSFLQYLTLSLFPWSLRLPVNLCLFIWGFLEFLIIKTLKVRGSCSFQPMCVCGGGGCRGLNNKDSFPV